MNNGKEEMRDFIKEAEELLVAARHDLNMGDYYSCFSKSYHAMVLSIKASLSLFEGRFSKMEIEVLSRDVEKKFKDIHDQILLMDNGAGFILNGEEVKEFLEEAGDFVQKSKNDLEEWLQTKGEK